MEYAIDGRLPATYNAGEVLLVPPETVHSVRNVGSGNAAELATYIVEQGKSLRPPSNQTCRRGRTHRHQTKTLL